MKKYIVIFRQHSFSQVHNITLFPSLLLLWIFLPEKKVLPLLIFRKTDQNNTWAPASLIPSISSAKQLTDGVALWTSVLEVRRVTDRDYTTYTCIAHNTEGEHSLNLTLGPPLPPQAPYNLTVSGRMSRFVIVKARAVFITGCDGVLFLSIVFYVMVDQNVKKWCTNKKIIYM